MTPRDIAKWIHDEHARVQEFTYDVRKQLAVPPVGQLSDWLPRLRTSFSKLATHLRNHMAMEEEGGYMKGVERIRPTLSRKVEALHHEHSELDRLMRELDASIAELRPEDNLLIRHAIARIGMFLAYVEQHKHEEENLVMYAFNQDLGTGD
ncbi:MAG: hemerythrin domain-containing protein [Phycisphaerae bacterium]|nr:hemerythrin domain-containing protein [Phycisphaerae bacterium]